MVIVILILIFCGAMLLLCRMLCGFTTVSYTHLTLPTIRLV